MAPDWEMSARSPVRGMEAAKLALSFEGGASTPRQLGPTSRRPLARAACSLASASDPGPWPRPELMMMADAAHEILRDRDDVRDRALARIDAFLAGLQG